MLREMEDEAPETIRTLAEGCARFVREAIGVAPDGTPETFPILDHYLSEADPGEKEAVLGLIASSAGAYFGEVVRRITGARWHLSDPEDASSWRLELGHVFLSFNPVGMAREAITGQLEEGWNAHLEVLEQDRRVLAQALENVGSVNEEDYFRLAVRWEVIEQAIAVLEAAAQARGEAELRYGPDAYARVLGA